MSGFYGSTNSQIWMGSLEPYMTEQFIISAFRSFGDAPLRVKIMRDKNSGEVAGYCFIHYESEEVARNVLHKLNNKIIPNSNPPARFKLNYAGSPSGRMHSGSANDEYSLFVGDLSSEVDDYMLYKCLSSRYPSIRTAKVVLDANGISKGYAFVRFADISDQRKCTSEMNGYTGLGSRPLKIGLALPREQRWRGGGRDNNQSSSSNTVVPTYDYTQNYYDQAAAWQGYSWPSNNYYYQQQQTNNLNYGSFYGNGPSIEGTDEMALVEHTVPLNIDDMNAVAVSRDLDFWDSIESSKWSPLEAAG